MTTSSAVPDAAVEAAKECLRDNIPPPHYTGDGEAYFDGLARRILAAALPHLETAAKVYWEHYVADQDTRVATTDDTESREALNGARPLPFDRETLGRMVREAWIRWAQTQHNPKPSWLVGYDELSESDKEADRQIGEAIARWTLIGDAASRSLPAAAAILRANGYVVEEPKVKALSEEIVNRRFGREHVLPCKDPNTITCALYKCQISNECQIATCSGTGARPAGEKT